MRFTYVLVLLCVLAVVAMAANPDKAARRAEKKARKAEKKALRQAMKEKCKPTVTYGACENNQMTKTITFPENVDGCRHSNKPAKTFTKLCTWTKDIANDDGCNVTLDFDITQCGQTESAQNMKLTVTATAECTDVTSGVHEIPCSGGGGFRKLVKTLNLKKSKKGNKKGGMKRKSKKTKKERRANKKNKQ